MKIPSTSTRALITRRITRAKLEADDEMPETVAARAVLTVRNILFEHSSLEGALLALFDPRVHTALLYFDGAPFDEPSLEFLSDSIRSRTLTERVELFCILLDYIEEEELEDERYPLDLALSFLELKVVFPMGSVGASVTCVLASAFALKVEQDVRSPDLSVFRRAAEALILLAELP